MLLDEDGIPRLGIGRAGVTVKPSQVVHVHLETVGDCLQGFICADDSAFTPEIGPRYRNYNPVPGINRVGLDTRISRLDGFNRGAVLGRDPGQVIATFNDVDRCSR